ncbi:MAG: MoxR family ATPase [Planctomycetes bacterium]|nr:MoxR family ATPase [Planctomycetota bacterium]MCB9918424.1 MoxR family ATPase [Planctomycetota bacterium]
MATSTDSRVAEKEAGEFRAVHGKIKAEVQRFIVGQENVIDAALTALFAGGHVMLEGVPGLGKTMLVRAIGEAVDIHFSRIQFTPDLMPADIQGTNVLIELEGGGHELRFQQGPLVSNLVLADEINRATPRTQSALLEAMQEKQISVSNRVIKLDEPYCVMATQNPVEQEGTYPLPEAQLDRFLMKVLVGYPKLDEYDAIVDRTTGASEVEIKKVSSGAEILRFRKVIRSVPVPERAKKYAVRLVVGTQPKSDYACALVNESVSLGASPRGVQGLMLAAKVRALLEGRFAVSVDDVKAVALPVLRHRVLINFHGMSEGVTADDVVHAVLQHVEAPNFD